MIEIIKGLEKDAVSLDVAG